MIMTMKIEKVLKIVFKNTPFRRITKLLESQYKDDRPE